MDKDSIYPRRESAFYSIYEVEVIDMTGLIQTLDHIKLKGENLISVAACTRYYTIVAEKP